MNTPTPRTDTEITFTGAYTCTHHNDQMRAACPVCLVSALTAERDELRDEAASQRLHGGLIFQLTAERDQLRADCENETKWAAHYLAESIAVKAERDQLRAEVERFKGWLSEPQALHAHCLRTLNEGQIAHLFGERMTEIVNRAERAEAIVGKLQELHGCSQEMVVHWCEHAANRSLGLDQARSELATEQEKSERYRLASLKLDAELAAERARLDWVFHNCKVTADDFTTGNRDVYAIHDREDLGAAMKEGEK
jgi:hypothetical protein